MEEKTTGKKIEDLNFKIEDLRKLRALIDTKSMKEKMRKESGDVAPSFCWGAGDFLDGVNADLDLKIEQLEADKAHLIASDPAPESIICPHCNYDGEFDKDHPQHDGFRLLEPVLEPKMILQFEHQSMLLSDRDESFDQFDCIAEPFHIPNVDNEKSPAYQEMRKLLRGAYLILCGSCFKYFSASEWIEKVEMDYQGDNPHTSKWRERKKTEVSDAVS